MDFRMMVVAPSLIYLTFFLTFGRPRPLYFIPASLSRISVTFTFCLNDSFIGRTFKAFLGPSMPTFFHFHFSLLKSDFV